MIRVNLLDKSDRSGGRIESLVRREGAASFSTRKEVLLAGLLLGLGCVILITQIQPVEEEPVVEAAAPVEPEAVEEEDLVFSMPPRTPAAVPVVAPEAEPVPAVEEPLDPVDTAGTQAQAQAEPEAPAPVAAATGVVPTVTSVQVSDLGGLLTIHLKGSGQPETSSFQLDRPKRIAIDFDPARLELSGELYSRELTHPIVQRIRVAQNRISPPRVRLVLDVKEFAKVAVLPGPGGIVIQVSPQ